MIKSSFFIAAILCICEISYATKVSYIKENCPVCDHEIRVYQIESYGSYIYDWESKYDIIYWPDTEPGFIYICQKCGYAQIHNHFFDISGDQKESLKSYLAKTWTPQEKVSPEVRYEQAILVNTFLEMDEDFWARFYRILIYFYRTNNPDKAIEYAEKEIELLKNNRGELPDDKKTRPYLLGEYHRIIGDASAANNYFDKALKADLCFKVKAEIFTFVALTLISLAILSFMWIKKLFTMKFRALSTAIIVILIIARGSALTNYANTEIKEIDNFNNYYNNIIEDRLKLLDKK
jgi:uncharacterized protein (DUF2225 family)